MDQKELECVAQKYQYLKDQGVSIMVTNDYGSMFMFGDEVDAYIEERMRERDGEGENRCAPQGSA